MQRLAEAIERQRLHVIFEIGTRDRCIVGIRLRERAELRRRHRHRPASQQRVLHADEKLAPPMRGQRIERAHAVRPCRPCAIASGPADFRRRRADPCTTSIPSRCRRAPLPMPDSSRICGEFTAPALRITSQRALRDVVDVAAAIFHADAARAFEHEPLRVRAGDRREIGTLHRGAQECFRRVPANAALLVHVEIADAGVVAAIEVVGGGNAGLLRGLRERLRESSTSGAASRRAIRRPRHAIRSRRRDDPRCA